MNVPVVGRIDAGSVPSSTEIETCRYTSDSDKTVRSSSYDFSDHRFISASRTFCHRSRRFISECYHSCLTSELCVREHHCARINTSAFFRLSCVRSLRPIRLDFGWTHRDFFCLLLPAVRIILRKGEHDE